MPVPDRRRRITAFVVAIAVLIATPLAVVASDAFTDVADNNVHHDDITWLADAGVTLGCNPPTNDRFCPGDPVLRQQMASFMRRLAENKVVDAATAVTAESAPGILLELTQMNAACPNSSITADADFSKIADIGTFTKVDGDSTLVVTFNGRVWANATNGTGVRYELRVDDAASPHGWARMVLRAFEVGIGTTGSMTGVFDGLDAGTHTVSMWAVVSNGNSATQVMWDPGCFSSDHVIIQEFAAFGS